MRSTQALGHPALGPLVSRRRLTPSTLLTALRPRLRAPRLDRQLSSGMVSWRSPVHAARSLQLTNHRRRRRLACSLERLIGVTEQPPVAYLRELLCNGDSPVYARSPAGALTAELHALSEMLDVQD